MDLSKVLNDQQLKAATYLDSDLRIIAGAGSGKTRVLTYRIAYLIEDVGINPIRILAVTFTNKAANEMKTRVQKILDTEAIGSTICTIHSLCVRILRQEIRVLGYPVNFIIMDEEDQKALLKKLLKENNLDSKTLTPKSLIHYISSYKCARVKPDRALELASFDVDKNKAVIYGKYEEYKQQHFMLDFDDLLIMTLEIFEDYPDILEKWQNRFDFIHVDEFQDVGEIDYMLIYYLSKQATLCVVGDPDQTIYSFRGSDVNFILDFEVDFPHSETIILNQNYRSTSNILDVSNHLISKNKNRLKKDLFTDADSGKNIVHYTANNDEDEAQYVVNKINKIMENNEDVKYSDFVILYRANYLSRPIEQELIRQQISYRIFGSLKFFNRKEIKDALSYIRLMVNNDDLSFERIINVPSRGIGAKTLEKIQLKAIEQGISNYDAICQYRDEMKLSSKIKTSLTSLINVIEKARDSKESLPVILETLLKDVGYIEMLKKDQEENRIANIFELENSINAYCNANPDLATFDNYLQDIALYTSGDEASDEDYVSLMSIHMAKGLEFNYVFVVGMSENIFPSMRAISEGGEESLEEERRLAYVAFTRAKKELYLTENSGYSFVAKSPKTSSRFISEIGRKNVDHAGHKSYHKIDYGKEVIDSYNDDYVFWSEGEYIMHDTFGKGMIVQVEPGGFIKVAFEYPHGVKTLMANHKSIHKITN